MGIADAKEKLEAREKLASGKLPLYFGALNTFLTQNGDTGFYVGSTMTVADIAMWRLLGIYYSYISHSSLVDYIFSPSDIGKQKTVPPLLLHF